MGKLTKKTNKEKYWLLTVADGNDVGSVYTYSSKEEALNSFEELDRDTCETAYLSECEVIKETKLSIGLIEE